MAALIGFTLASAPPANAKDLCFLINNVNVDLKGFSPPPRDRCKPVMGYSTVQGWILTGTACTKADGSTLRLGISANSAVIGINTLEFGCNIPLPSLASGTCAGVGLAPGGSPNELVAFTNPGVTLTPCTADVP